MSQEKVDKYKKDKANRKKILAKQKRILFLEKSVAALIGIAFIAFVCVSVYFEWFYKEKKESTAQAATYSLSEEEISSVWNAYDESKAAAEATTAAEETTVPETTAEETTVEETTEAVENSSDEDNDDEDYDNDDEDDEDEDEDEE